MKSKNTPHDAFPMFKLNFFEKFLLKHFVLPKYEDCDTKSHYLCHNLGFFGKTIREKIRVSLGGHPTVVNYIMNETGVGINPAFRNHLDVRTRWIELLLEHNK